MCFNMKRNTDARSEKRFKNFDETFPVCAFALAFGFMYPNRTNIRKRIFFISMIIVFNGVEMFWGFSYSYQCLLINDMYNLSRNLTLSVVIVLFFVKTYYSIGITDKLGILLRWMSRDLLRVNSLSEDYKEICQEHIKYGKFAELLWSIIPVVLSGFYPVYAGLTMSINSIKTDDYEKVMVHELDLMFLEHLQYDWPYFHIIFFYNCCQCVLYAPNFSGFDGSFCIATTHLRMKLKLMTRKLQEAYSEPRSHTDLKARVTEVIMDHQDALRFYNMVQDIYGPWLFLVFTLSSFLISMNLYTIYYLQRFEPKYTMFGVFGGIHIYAPCYYAATLAEVGEAIALEIYTVPWESTRYVDVTRMLVIMLARAQRPLILIGWIIIFNMNLFTSILQTSYSVFTLLTAT